MDNHYASEAKKYCSGIEMLLITIVTVCTLISFMGIVLFVFTGVGIIIIIIPIIVLFIYLIKRRLFMSLLVKVSNDIKYNRVTDETAIAVSCKPDLIYRKLGASKKSKLNAGERYILKLNNGNEYRMTKSFNLKRFIDPLIKITYLESSKVVLKLELIEIDPRYDDINLGEIKNKETFIKNRKTIRYTKGKIRLPLIMAVSKDDVLNRLYINVYYDDIEDFENDMSIDIELMQELTERLKKKISSINSEKIDKVEEIKTIIKDVVELYYKEVHINNIKLVIERH